MNSTMQVNKEIKKSSVTAAKGKCKAENVKKYKLDSYPLRYKVFCM